MARDSKALVEIAIKVMGSPDGLADAINTHRTTVRRWLNGASVPGPARVAIMAVIKHPEEFVHLRREKKKPGRPASGSDEDSEE